MSDRLTILERGKRIDTLSLQRRQEEWLLERNGESRSVALGRR